MWQFTETLGEGAYGEYVKVEIYSFIIQVQYLESFLQKMSIQMNSLLLKLLI